MVEDEIGRRITESQWTWAWSLRATQQVDTVEMDEWDCINIRTFFFIRTPINVY